MSSAPRDSSGRRRWRPCGVCYCSCGGMVVVPWSSLSHCSHTQRVGAVRCCRVCIRIPVRPDTRRWPVSRGPLRVGTQGAAHAPLDGVDCSRVDQLCCGRVPMSHTPADTHLHLSVRLARLVCSSTKSARWRRCRSTCARRQAAVAEHGRAACRRSGSASGPSPVGLAKCLVAAVQRSGFPLENVQQRMRRLENLSVGGTTTHPE
jgi:hypothetical protein